MTEAIFLSLHIHYLMKLMLDRCRIILIARNFLAFGVVVAFQSSNIEWSMWETTVWMRLTVISGKRPCSVFCFFCVVLVSLSGAAEEDGRLEYGAFGCRN